MTDEFKNKKILVIEAIEDDASLRKALHDKLVFEGFRVIEAKDGEEGLALALREHPDLILLDIVLPKMDGMTMLGELHKDKWGKDAKVIVLTNLSDVPIAHGSYEYLLKSDWKIEEVVAKVRERLEK